MSARPVAGALHVDWSGLQGAIEGTRLGDLYATLDADGLTIAAGCGPSVGIAGLTLGGGVCELDWMPFGGAYNRVDTHATAFPHRDARFLLKHKVVFDAEASSREKALAKRWLAESWRSAHPWGSGGVYVNFRDPDLVSSENAYGTNYERLRAAIAQYDPANLFRFR